MNARIPPEPEPAPGLWDGWAPPSGIDVNSEASAASLLALGAVGSLRREAAAMIARNGPIAEWELESYMQRPGNTIRPRVYELHAAGVIERIEEKGVTPSGRSCWQYVITATGRHLLSETA